MGQRNPVTAITPRNLPTWKTVSEVWHRRLQAFSFQHNLCPLRSRSEGSEENHELLAGMEDKNAHKCSAQDCCLREGDQLQCGLHGLKCLRKSQPNAIAAKQSYLP